MVVQQEEISDILQRIGDLLRRQGPLRPVREGLGLLQGYLEDLLHELGIADLGPVPDHRRRDLRVEDGRRHGPGQHREDLQVLASRVEHLQDAGIIEQREEGGQLGQRPVVDDGDLIAGRDLDDLEPRVEGVLPHELRVHRQAVVAAEPLAEGDQPGFVLDILRVW